MNDTKIVTGWMSGEVAELAGRLQKLRDEIQGDIVSLDARLEEHVSAADGPHGPGHRPVYGALSKAQAAMSFASKGAINPFHKSKYADYASVVEAVRGPLTDNGLCYFHTVVHLEGGLEVITTIAHESGDSVSCSVFMPIAKWDAQAVGSALTYGKRYGLVSLTGIPADTDDDGEAAMPRKPKADTLHQSVPTQTGVPALSGKALYDALLAEAKAGTLNDEKIAASGLPKAAKDLLTNEMNEVKNG